MRIIDKNTDFYDYLQNIYRDNSIVFDRHDSFVLTKEMVCKYVGQSIQRLTYRVAPRLVGRKVFLLIQICNKFYLFWITVTSQEVDSCLTTPTSYDVDYICSWDNYNKERKLISIDTIRFDYSISDYFEKNMSVFGITTVKYDGEWVKKNTETLKKEIDTNNYKVIYNLNDYTLIKGDGTKEEKHVPLLKESGLSMFLNPLDVFLKIEEYFSAEKTSNERTDSVGITDKEKIENHGFDNKQSFRGKV